MEQVIEKTGEKPVQRNSRWFARIFSLPDDYSVVLGNGGATLLFDMIALGMVQKKSAHYTCGEFSKKWYKSHNKVPWIEMKKSLLILDEDKK